ncbi:cell division protein FtsL [Desulfohalotomaculum tongense]|uniref:hypothetical protein n=1 Tax=Desulforadius tongensis TaxID=1216062 RepID=UPI00195D2CBD|nr:hypothetical protein [Desulforadius tongensis]MBM7854806.1 cell division protein FtsL [Desulforadius tongensis]
MEGIKIFALCLSIIGILIVVVSVLYKKYRIHNKDDSKNEYADIAILQGLFIILYSLVMYFYLPNKRLMFVFISVFIVLESLILVYRKNSAYWLTARITALRESISAKIKRKETKADDGYWMYTVLIVVIIAILSLPFWINPNYPHNYVATIYITTGILMYIRSFLFKNDEGRISAYDVFAGLACLCFGLIMSTIDDTGFTAFHGKMFVSALFLIFKRKPPKRRECKLFCVNG